MLLTLIFFLWNMKLVSFFYSVHKPTAGTTLLHRCFGCVWGWVMDTSKKPHCSCSHRISLKADSSLHFIWTAKLKVKMLALAAAGKSFPSPMHESENWKWRRSVVSDSWRPHGLQPTRLLCPRDFPGKSTGVGCHCLLH